MILKIADSWKNILQDEFQKPYFSALSNFVKSEYNHHVCYPDKKDIFSAFHLCAFDKVKVVIIGQDPYHDVNQANGLCFCGAIECWKNIKGAKYLLDEDLGRYNGLIANYIKIKRNL